MATKPTPAPAAAPGLDFQAPQIEFRKDANEIVGKGGVKISEGGVQVQAEEGVFNTQTKQGDVKGNVVMTTSSGVLTADSARLNVEGETGEFSGLEFDVEEGGYRVESDKARKLSEFEFELQDTDMTSCRCPDGAKPWEISSSRCNITQGGYAHSYDSTFYFQGLPLIYSPYLVFPVKNERASGLLPASFGSSNRDGFEYSQPVFLSVDDTTGFTVRPFVATRTRVGGEVTFERVFSETSSVNAGLLYSNESLRIENVNGKDEKQLRGLTTAGIADPSIDTDRLGGFYRQNWISDKKDPYPIEVVADGHYVSDNMFLREIPEPNIGVAQAQYLVSSAVARGTAFEFLNLEGRSEYTQQLLEPQELQFQRLPELLASATHTVRPFGANPLGFKLVTSADAVGTGFVREDGYDGTRSNLHPKITAPFHVSNFFRGQFGAELHQTNYQLGDTSLPPAKSSYYPTAAPTPSDKSLQATDSDTEEMTEMDSSYSRTLPILTYGMGTGLERVYDLPRDSWFSRVVSLGAANEGSELTRLKHTIEPAGTYMYVPDVDQADNPQFDSLDRFYHRSLATYGVTSRLYGRFHEPYERTREVEELSAGGDTIPVFDLSQSLLDFGRGAVLAPERVLDTREGEIRELGQVFVRQGYYLSGYDAARGVNDGKTSGVTDWQLGFVVSPSSYFSTGLSSNYNQDEGLFSSHDLSFGFRDDRDDMLRFRYTFVNNDVQQALETDQLEGNFELKLTEQLRAGAYARYNMNSESANSGFIESQGLLRFTNSCRCWSIDLGVGERVNPDRRQVLLGFTLGGVGGMRQGMGMR
jgi:lipopolysaccharide assembly outer membrane protein LptD (OstA)